MFDLTIVGGEVIDGTGAPRRRADVGITGGRIVEIGDLAGPSARRIDAAGKVVTPGFIDVHTHYDAQVAWDPYLTPSPLHGVTTVIGGNCGFTLAPMEEEAVPYLTAMLARVEGMPLASVRAGVDIRWRSFGEYLDTVEGNVGLNVGFLVGHSTVRRLVLGEDWRREASDEEIAEMCTSRRSQSDVGSARVLVVVGGDAQRRRRRPDPIAICPGGGVAPPFGYPSRTPRNLARVHTMGKRTVPR